MAVYATLVWPVWLAMSWNPGAWTRTLLLVMLLATALKGTLRAHLLFTTRFNAPAIGGDVRRTRSWLLGSDLAVSGALVAASVDLIGSRPAVGVAISGFGIGIAGAPVAIEPATTRAAVPREDGPPA
jgi:hypothetical protein